MSYINQIKTAAVILLLLLPLSLFAAPEPEMYTKAYQAYQNNDNKQAETLFLQFINEKPDDFYTANAYFWLGMTYFKQKKFQEALFQFEAVRTCQNVWKHPDAMMKAGMCYVNLGKKEEAKATFQRLISLFPEEKEKAQEAANRLKAIK